jgi:hypothetical protein
MAIFNFVLSELPSKIFTIIVLVHKSVMGERQAASFCLSYRTAALCTTNFSPLI